jgi:hypothetical protein
MVIVATVVLTIFCLLTAHYLPPPPEIIAATMRGLPT